VDALHGPLSFVRCSRAYESAAWSAAASGALDQTAAASGASDPSPKYLNLVLSGRTRLSAEALLAFAKALEWAAGRRRGARCADRPLDVDLLLWGDRHSDRPELRLPHPGADSRPFVCLPRAELRSGTEAPSDLLLDPNASADGEWPTCLGSL
jgi:2-amino-4-hydroxy-6-hydroxymethyldihydropteridine diphosphokinase